MNCITAHLTNLKNQGGVVKHDTSQDHERVFSLIKGVSEYKHSLANPSSYEHVCLGDVKAVLSSSFGNYCNVGSSPLSQQVMLHNKQCLLSVPAKLFPLTWKPSKV